ncbi:GMC oxidoreductase [Paenibacillus medicaginis]|uniref:GMC oxidoreductase n=1 Tax=Paenibacillus medicaginis TaxID=1470560 RepID=A0ABV5C060_9BACL
MRIYVAGEGDTLYRLASHYQIGIDQLMSSNPHIDRPDRMITGMQVRIPSPPASSAPRVVPPFCPPPPPEAFIHNWIPLSSAEEMAATEYDVLIVGSGIGGCAALWRLCDQWGQNGKRIGMVERGPQYLATHIMNVSTMDGVNFRLFRPSQITDLVGEHLPQFSGLKLIYALGGRGTLWGCITPRVPDFDIAKNWPISPSEMVLYYNIAEEVMSVTQEYTRNSLITQILLERLRRQGFANADDIPIAADLSPTLLGKVNSNVFSSTINLLAKALNRRSFDLAVDTYCAEVLTEGGRAAGVRVITPDKRSHVIKAKTVILSASALQTPRILLNSGIQGSAIGRYLLNHSYLVVRATLNTTSFPDPLGTLGIVIPELENRPYRIQIQGPEQYFDYHYLTRPDKHVWNISDYYISGVVEPRYENRVLIDPSRKDAYGMPELQVNFSYSAKDEAIIEQMYDAAVQSAGAMQMQLETTDGVPSICLMPPGADNHDAGTCRMGEDPNTSATDQFGQIHGVPGLYVADASVLPSMGASNPALSVIALAIRTADQIVKQNP